MIALKTYRHDLNVHLATYLAASAPGLGKAVNPPAVIVQSGATYVDALDYCSDRIEFEATIIAPPGDLAAVADALDDMIDQVRATCATRSSLGVKYQFVQVGGYTTFIAGDTELPAVIATIAVERQI